MVHQRSWIRIQTSAIDNLCQMYVDNTKERKVNGNGHLRKALRAFKLKRDLRWANFLTIISHQKVLSRCCLFLTALIFHPIVRLQLNIIAIKNDSKTRNVKRSNCRLQSVSRYQCQTNFQMRLLYSISSIENKNKISPTCSSTISITRYYTT